MCWGYNQIIYGVLKDWRAVCGEMKIILIEVILISRCMVC